MNKLNYTIIALLFIVFLGCKDKNDNFVFLSIEQDVELGAQVSAEIENDPTQYPILDEEEYAAAYAYLGDLVDEILESGEVEYKDEFAWEFKIIADDSVLNAFATPGGYIYVYTGLIKYLDQEDDLMGVLGHEIAHADLRHTSRNLQRQYGIQVLLGLLVGENASQLESIAGQIAGTAAGLSFSREFETEADAKSVDYLAKTKYACNAAASFFQKLIDQGQAGGTPQFLSTHPSPANRVEDINAKATEVGCETDALNPTTYEDFKQLLP
ncbi:peptidase M48 [Marivirga lumbricoides]|uniref:Peptidase M48 n=1 Tax=Marivirga lumbricoides TaxID=1046115 RepID=A0A2T4DT34_9BACT|nr:peptidase M48 [Marivirga lumbricoides]GGC19786.1 peptidase M48 [Marivirga lumbricoides]